jgi:cellulose biosynthesis protein BcsQ
MKVVAAYNIKGGVGKTAISVNLAHAASAKHRVLLWDLDEQGGASMILGNGNATSRRPGRSSQLSEQIEPSIWDGISYVPAARLDNLIDRHDLPKRLRELLGKVGNSFDRVILDCPPARGAIADQIFEAADLIVVPVIPAALSIAAFESLQDRIASRKGAKPPLLPVFSQADLRRGGHRRAIEEQPDWIVIPYSVAMERMVERRLPIALSAPRSSVAAPLARLWKAVERH